MKLRVQLLLLMVVLLAWRSAVAQNVIPLSSGYNYPTLKQIGCVPIDGTNSTTETLTLVDTGPGCIARENARKIQEFLLKLGTNKGVIDATHNGQRGLRVDDDYAIADHDDDDIDIIFPAIQGGGMICDGALIHSYFYEGAPGPWNQMVACRLFHTGDPGDTMIQYRGVGGVFYLNLVGKWIHNNTTEHNNALSAQYYAGTLFQLRNISALGFEEAHGANMQLSLYGAYAKRGIDSPHWHTTATGARGTYQDSCQYPDCYFTCVDNYVVIDEIQSLGHQFGRIMHDGTLCKRMFTFGSADVIPFTMNGAFTNNALTWDLAGGAAYNSNTIRTTTGAGTASQKQVGVQNNTLHTVTFTTSGVATGGTVTCTLGGVTVGSTRSTNGTWSNSVTSTSTNPILTFTFGGGGTGAVTIDDVSVYAAPDVEGGSTLNGGGGDVHVNWLYHPNGTMVQSGPNWSYTGANFTVSDFKLDSNFYNSSVKTLLCNSLFQSAKFRFCGNYGPTIDHQMFEVYGNSDVGQADIQCDIKGQPWAQRGAMPMRRMPGDKWDASTVFPATLASSTKLWVRPSRTATWTPSSLIQGASILTIDDFSSSDNDLTTGIAPTYVEYGGNWSPAVYCGAGGYLVDTTPSADIATLNNFTVMLTCKETHAGYTGTPPRPINWGNYQTLVSCSNNPAVTANGFTIFIEQFTGKVILRCKGVDLISDVAIYIDRPNLIIATRNGTTGATTLVVNGTVKGGTTTIGALGTAAGPLTFGAMANGGVSVTFPFKGEIGDVIVDDTACALPATTALYSTDASISGAMGAFYWGRLQYLRAMYNVW